MTAQLIVLISYLCNFPRLAARPGSGLTGLKLPVLKPLANPVKMDDARKLDSCTE
ncbi:hypothetical protein [Methylomicrobium agile]|jgi:hypothetical protein|uniref:hypothetical protein n=1 Tax=Methylomicrobium agile TaxID=39774 RepID=UPI0012F6F0A9|nr:hypothetical protein [Methylomicrobium agile]